MKTFYRTLKSDKLIINGDKQITLKKGKDYITSQTKKGECWIFTKFWFKAPSKWFKNVRLFTK